MAQEKIGNLDPAIIEAMRKQGSLKRILKTNLILSILVGILGASLGTGIAVFILPPVCIFLVIYALAQLFKSIACLFDAKTRLIGFIGLLTFPIPLLASATPVFLAFAGMAWV